MRPVLRAARILQAIGGLAALLCAPLAAAAPLSFTVTGTISDVLETGMSLDGSVGVGTRFSITGSLDTARPDTLPSRAAIGIYPIATPPGTLSIVIGNYVLEATIEGYVVDIVARPGPSADRLSVAMLYPLFAGSAAPAGTVHANAGFTLGTFSNSPNAIASDSLSVIPIFSRHPELWDSNHFDLLFATEDYLSYVTAYGEIDSFVVVPEPGLGWIPFAVLALAARSRRAAGTRRPARPCP